MFLIPQFPKFDQLADLQVVIFKNVGMKSVRKSDINSLDYVGFRGTLGGKIHDANLEFHESNPGKNTW